jgi:hypothetical protein
MYALLARESTGNGTHVGFNLLTVAWKCGYPLL